MIHVFISGRVQGVGFRRYLKDKAEKLNVKGWVKNLSDRRVEAVFQGDMKEVEKMIEYSRKGPFLAEVWDMQIIKEPEQGFKEFSILK